MVRPIVILDHVALHPFLSSENPIAFAHRGGAHEAPENTLEAFHRAVDLGFQYLETDARLTADGIPFAFHDPLLDRVSDREGAVNEMTWEQLSDVVIHPGQNGGGRLATIEQLLQEFPDTNFNIDTKSASVVGPLLDVLEENDALDRVCLASFFDQRLASIRQRLGDRACVSQGPFETITSLARGLLGQESDQAANRPLQVPTSIGPLPVIRPKLIRAAQRFGSPVQVWTVDDPQRMHELLDMGVDGIMTDHPSVLRGVMVERGQWPTGG